MKLDIYEFILNPDSDHFTTSLVKDPAVESTLMYFNSEMDKPIFFANEEKRVIYAVAMRPMKHIFRKETDKMPAHYGYFTAESIEKFQENYARHNGDGKVNVNHTETPIDGVFKIENWIVKDIEADKTKALGLEAQVGDLIQGFKIENDAVWEQCKNGNLDGLSIEASLGRKLVSNFKTEINMTKLEKVTKFFAELFADEVVETEEEKAARLEAEKMAEEPAPAPAPNDELKAENEMLKAKVTELEAELANIEAEKAKEGAELETMKAQTLKATEELAKFKAETAASLAIKNVPTLEVAVPYEQMSNFKKTKFNRQNR